MGELHQICDCTLYAMIERYSLVALNFVRVKLVIRFKRSTKQYSIYDRRCYLLHVSVTLNYSLPFREGVLVV